MKQVKKSQQREDVKKNGCYKIKKYNNRKKQVYEGLSLVEDND